jgi:hypothetical protein
MLSKCANPICSASFKYFRQGKVFEVRSDSSHFAVSITAGAVRESSNSVQHYWLCAKCSAKMTIAVNRNREILVLPLTVQARGAAA